MQLTNDAMTGNGQISISVYIQCSAQGWNLWKTALQKSAYKLLTHKPFLEIINVYCYVQS